ncbi:uncharacterized protein Gasu_62070 [Galdieria sulphuraria]|uniref:RING-type domain-containing protein n=1 Tax=Galdieria sulphuraria TaxID=130081 RepID=M2X8G6_GALSU|nr:uncharacterized protein Gasu_62070 [Galdieria sulphuraria]EME26142.1 hypothetical protein Gasu_62070 [Galdieria sulphuraria]|eukprot:XP_005702662.1 hypothetical protein Gasu_62070 [Galdieria sulphuraria]
MSNKKRPISEFLQGLRQQRSRSSPSFNRNSSNRKIIHPTLPSSASSSSRRPVNEASLPTSPTQPQSPPRQSQPQPESPSPSPSSPQEEQQQQYEQQQLQHYYQELQRLVAFIANFLNTDPALHLLQFFEFTTRSVLMPSIFKDLYLTFYSSFTDTYQQQMLLIQTLQTQANAVALLRSYQTDDILEKEILVSVASLVANPQVSTFLIQQLYIFRNTLPDIVRQLNEPFPQIEETVEAQQTKELLATLLHRFNASLEPHRGLELLKFIIENWSLLPPSRWDTVLLNLLNISTDYDILYLNDFLVSELQTVHDERDPPHGYIRLSSLPSGHPSVCPICNDPQNWIPDFVRAQCGNSDHAICLHCAQHIPSGCPFCRQ